MFQPTVVPDFSGGMNSASYATEIDDNQAALILNMRFKDRKNLTSRGGMTKLTANAAPTNPVKGIHYYAKQNGNEFVLYCHDAKVHQKVPGGTGNWTDASAGTLPSNKYYSWITAADNAIGANGTSSDNPIKWSGAGNVAVLGGFGGAGNYVNPKPSYLEFFNFRVFLAGCTASGTQNTVYASGLSDPENWTNVSAWNSVVGPKDGDVITGIKSHKGLLFIFKRHHIYRIVPGDPNTDTTQYVIELVTANGGCASHFTIWPVEDDLLFLSEFGVASLVAVQDFGDFKQGLISRDVDEFATRNKTVTAVAGVNYQDSEYWISIASSGSSSNDQTFVLDYKDRSNLKWTKHNGKAAASYLAAVRETGVERFYVGGFNDIYRYADTSVYQDDGANFTKQISTKAYTHGDAQAIKQGNDWAVTVAPITASVTVNLATQYDEDTAKSANTNLTFTTGTAGAQRAMRAFFAAIGKRFRSVQFIITNSANEAFTLLEMKWGAVALGTKKRSSDV